MIHNHSLNSPVLPKNAQYWALANNRLMRSSNPTLAGFSAIRVCVDSRRTIISRLPILLLGLIPTRALEL